MPPLFSRLLLAFRINLIQANHVILVEPIMNLSAEHQAIGRIHRIGQLKPTFVHRFLVSGTIEERLYNMLKTFRVRARNWANSEEGFWFTT